MQSYRKRLGCVPMGFYGFPAFGSSLSIMMHDAVTTFTCSLLPFKAAFYTYLLISACKSFLTVQNDGLLENPW